MKKYKLLLIYLNMWRILVMYFCICNCKFKEKTKKDIDVWIEKNAKTLNKNRIIRFGYVIIDSPEFRNVLLNRLHRNIIMYIICRILFPPLDSLYIKMPPENIGGGLYFQHGFSTIIAAKKIGENVSINQQVTIGYNGDFAPTLEDNITICAGAIVIGNVTIKSDSKVGAGAVVTKDIPENTVVAGVPAREITIKK